MRHHSLTDQPAAGNHSRWWQTLLRELSRFGRAAFGSLFSVEFLVVLVPVLLLWELLPRFGVVPPTLVPAPSKLVITARDMFVELKLAEHFGRENARDGNGRQDGIHDPTLGENNFLAGVDVNRHQGAGEI